MSPSAQSRGEGKKVAISQRLAAYELKHATEIFQRHVTELQFAQRLDVSTSQKQLSPLYSYLP